ncbi:hypothetical protein V3C99_016868, partial [Haemonchus contortus]
FSIPDEQVLSIITKMDHPALLRRINSIALQVQNLGYRHQVTASRLVVVIVVFIVAIHLFFKISLPNSLNHKWRLSRSKRHIGLRSDIISYERVKVSKQAQLLPKKGRLLCFVITTPKYHYTRVPAIYETWLPRCDHGQFFTSERMGEEVPHSTVLADLPDDYRYLFQKTMIALHYAYTNISDQFDWYYKHYFSSGYCLG